MHGPLNVIFANFVFVLLTVCIMFISVAVTKCVYFI